MKIISLYECGVCGHRHTTESDCIKCENAHSIPVAFRDIKYVPFYQYPHTLKVVFANGTLVEYVISDGDAEE